MTHHWRDKNGIEEIMSKRPYREINQPVKPGLVHTIIGIIIVALLIGVIIVLAAVFQPNPPMINDRAPAIEKLEKLEGM